MQGKLAPSSREMSMTWISDVLSALKLPPKVVAGIAIPSGVLVLARDSWLAQFGLDAFMFFARPYVSLVFIVASSILLVESLVYARNCASAKLKHRRSLAKLNERADALDPAELIVLREFFIQGQSTVKLPMDQPVVAGLIQKGIIQQVGQLGERTGGGMTFPFRIRDEVVHKITPEMLGLPANPTDQDRKRIVSERPQYMMSIQRHDELFHSRW